ncbi:hypothetical protein [Photobacterium leiognathi]|uniref:hypothetical protein n=1 Tax=Photobacterium leiognathi TaxID=553611 RepID=UPI0029816447|nr:hypothetical protein [Photobacterium leiognathi]
MLSEFLVDDRVELGVDCDLGVEGANCYCNCHSSDTADTTIVDVDLIRAGEKVSCVDSMANDDFDICLGDKTESFDDAVPAEPPKEIRKALATKACGAGGKLIDDQCVHRNIKYQTIYKCGYGDGTSGEIEESKLLKLFNGKIPPVCDGPYRGEKYEEVTFTDYHMVCPDGYEYTDQGFCVEK